jgi:hypothetical protein
MQKVPLNGLFEISKRPTKIFSGMENLFHDDKTAFPVCQHIFSFFFGKDEIGGQRAGFSVFGSCG